LENARAARYAGWNVAQSKAMLAGSLDEAAALVTAMNLDPKPRSGRQERLENIWNYYV